MTTFGVELEIIPVAGSEVGFQGRITRALRDAGYTARENRHFGTEYSVWQVKPDCTVYVTRAGRKYFGTEVVSPVLTADADGFEQVRRVCALLEEHGATANVNCGMHVHVGVGNKSVDELKNVVRAYGTFQKQIESVLPKSRRADGSKARWCRPIWNQINRVQKLDQIRRATTVNELHHFISGAYSSHGRYSVLNLTKYVNYGTLEFRQHSGTIDPNKAVNWAKFCVNFVDRYSRINVLEQTQSAPQAESSVQIQSVINGRGERRLPRRSCPVKRMIDALSAGENIRLSPETLCTIARDPKGQMTPESIWDNWLPYAAKTTGFSFDLDADGNIGLKREGQTTQAQMLTADPFRNCFDLFEGALAYFGRRRNQLGRSVQQPA